MRRSRARSDRAGRSSPSRQGREQDHQHHADAQEPDAADDMKRVGPRGGGVILGRVHGQATAEDDVEAH